MDWIDEFLVKPITRQTDYAPYNLVNTAVYAAIALIAAYLIYRGLRKLGIAVDERFFKAVIPFVFFGSLLRVFEDGRLLPRSVDFFGFTLFPFVTPQIYILTFVVLAACFAFAKIMEPRYWIRLGAKLGSAAALMLAIGLLVKLPVKNSLWLLAILAIAVAVMQAFAYYRKNQATLIEKTAVFSQVLDGAATFVGVQFLGYSEQHIVGNAIFDLFGGPLAFLVLKIVFVLAVVEILKRENASDNEKNFVLLLITIFGLAPGIRDAARMFFGV